MKSLILSAALLVSATAMANELDSATTVSPQQIEKAKDLPGTVIVRVNKKDPKQVEVVHLRERLTAGTQPKGLKFEKVALNAEVTGIAYDSANELDNLKSTSSWSFGVYAPGYGAAVVGRGPYGGYYGAAVRRGPYGGVYGRGYYGRPSYGYGYARPGYGYGGYYGRPYGYGYGYGYYAPTYQYSGYTYSYSQTYAYEDDDCYYDVYNW